MEWRPRDRDLAASWELGREQEGNGRLRSDQREGAGDGDPGMGVERG